MNDVLGVSYALDLVELDIWVGDAIGGSHSFIDLLVDVLIAVV